MKPHMININIHQSGQGILLEVFGCLFKVDNLWHLTTIKNVICI